MSICHSSTTSILAQISVPNTYLDTLLNQQWNSFAHAHLYLINSIICHAQTVNSKTTQSAHAKTPAQAAHKYLLYASSAPTLGIVKEFPHTLSCQLTSSIKNCHRAQSNQPQNSVQVSAQSCLCSMPILRIPLPHLIDPSTNHVFSNHLFLSFASSLHHIWDLYD